MNIFIMFYTLFHLFIMIKIIWIIYFNIILKRYLIKILTYEIFFPNVKYKLLEKYTYTKNTLRFFIESNLNNFLKKKYLVEFNFFII